MPEVNIQETCVVHGQYGKVYKVKNVYDDDSPTVLEYKVVYTDGNIEMYSEDRKMEAYRKVQPQDWLRNVKPRKVSLGLNI